MNAVLVGFILYLCLVLVVGLVTMSRNKTQADYLIGGRKLNAWVIAISERASGESAWLLLGLTGAALTVGLGKIWAVLGCLSGIIFAWIFIAAKLRTETEKYGAMTIPDYLARKFSKGSHSIQIVASLIIIFFFTFYVAAQFNGAGKVLNVTFGIPVTWGIVLGAIVILMYTMMGGFFAVAWTDLVQGIIMLGTLLVIPIVGFMTLSTGDISGVERIHSALEAVGPEKLSWTGGATGITAILFILSGLSWGLGYTGQPHTILRFVAIRDVSEIKKAAAIAITWAIPAFFGAFFIGLVGLGIYGPDHFTDPEKMMPALATNLLPAWLAGIFISGAIAAMMSTADSQILVATSAVTEDIYHRAMGKQPTQKRLVMISRIATLAIGIVAFILALTTKDLVFTLVSYAWGGLGASFGPVIVLSLYWRRLNRQGVMAGLLTGCISTIIWKNIDALQSVVPERLSAFILAFIAVVVTTLLTSKKTSEDNNRSEAA